MSNKPDRKSKHRWWWPFSKKAPQPIDAPHKRETERETEQQPSSNLPPPKQLTVNDLPVVESKANDQARAPEKDVLPTGMLRLSQLHQKPAQQDDAAQSNASSLSESTDTLEHETPLDASNVDVQESQSQKVNEDADNEQKRIDNVEKHADETNADSEHLESERIDSQLDEQALTQTPSTPTDEKDSKDAITSRTTQSVKTEVQTKIESKPESRAESKSETEVNNSVKQVDSSAKPRVKLNSISDMRRYFHRNDIPIYFISATNFNVLGISEWVKNFRYINYVDCFDGRHPNVLVPSEQPHREFSGIEDINNYLLRHKEVIDYIESRGNNSKAVFLMFDETTEALCDELGIEVWFPKSKLRERMDNKVETVRIGNRACVPSVPNVLAKVESYEQLRKVAGHLGENLVVQTPYGDSGKTTYFIANEDDWQRHAKSITAEQEVKIMKQVKCRGTAIEACTTRKGTVVGPLMTELVGFPELTPYKGGWCGNEIFAGAFTQEIREKAREYTVAFGDELRRMGYRGYFELDFLIDEESGELYLGELNPRVTGASSMTNHAAFAHADAPLFLFHLLEFSDVDFDLDIEDLNHRWSQDENIDSWSQLIIKHVGEQTDYIKQAPQSGLWRMDAYGRIFYERFDYHRRAVEDEWHGFYLRISGPGDYRFKGGDLGILITRGRLMNDDFTLNQRARHWIKGITGEYWAVPLEEAETPPTISLYDEPFKIL